jgi:hypothetical protein
LKGKAQQSRLEKYKAKIFADHFVVRCSRGQQIFQKSAFSIMHTPTPVQAAAPRYNILLYSFTFARKIINIFNFLILFN